jgi:hypothetical protein
LKSVSEMCYIRCVADLQAVPWFLANQPSAADLQRTTPMTVEILYLTAQIHRWINARVARHLAAQAAKLTH